MNLFKYNWYLATRDIPGIISGSQINTDLQKEFDSKLNKMKDFTNNQWWTPHSQWNAYNTPQGEIFIDVVLGLTMPAAVIGRRAKKVIEVTRHFSEILNDD